jgi:hypothetical protein
MWASRSAPLSLTRPAPALRISLSIGATGMILSFFDLGKTSHTPLSGINRPYTSVLGADWFKNFVLPERIGAMPFGLTWRVLALQKKQKRHNTGVFLRLISKKQNSSVLHF